MKDQLQMPSDLEDDEDEDEDAGDVFGAKELDKKGKKNKKREQDDFDQFNEDYGAEENESMENDVFGLARENREMNQGEELSDHAAGDNDLSNELNELDNSINKKDNRPFVNEKMVKKIEQIEDQMVGGKSWQMTGEVQAK